MKMELLPCPFCGAGTTRVVMNGQTWTGTKYSDPISVSVVHHCDPIEGQPSRQIERIGRDAESAIAAWNRRASPASVPEVTDGMAIAFHNALTDGSIGQSEVDEIKTGLRAAIAAASTPASIRGKDAERFRFMLDDHAEKTTRQRVRELFERLPVMSLSAARAAIDDLLKGE